MRRRPAERGARLSSSGCLKARPTPSTASSSISLGDGPADVHNLAVATSLPVV